MSLDKAIEHGKEHRKPYRGTKAIDPSCRNHGSCTVCKKNRLHKFRDKKPREEEDMSERTDNIKDLTLDNTRVFISSSGMCRITFSWSANIGFGEYTLFYDMANKKWQADSEYMDKDEDKDFLKAILEEFVKQVEVCG